MKPDNSDFYVYLWMRKDMLSPFYVGKGRGYRDTDRCRKGMKPPSDRNRIRRVKENLSEDEAFALEILLIKFYGRKCDGGILHNITEGGEGISGLRHTKESRRKMSESKKSLIKQRGHTRCGAVLSEETKNKIREKNKGSIPWNKGISGYKTRPASEHRKCKMGKRCVCDGIHFPTASHAAKHFGLSQPGVTGRIKSDKYLDWYWIDNS